MQLNSLALSPSARIGDDRGRWRSPNNESAAWRCGHFLGFSERPPLFTPLGEPVILGESSGLSIGLLLDHLHAPF